MFCSITQPKSKMLVKSFDMMPSDEHTAPAKILSTLFLILIPNTIGGLPPQVQDIGDAYRW